MSPDHTREDLQNYINVFDAGVYRLGRFVMTALRMIKNAVVVLSMLALMPVALVAGTIFRGKPR